MPEYRNKDIFLFIPNIIGILNVEGRDIKIVQFCMFLLEKFEDIEAKVQLQDISLK